MLGADATYTCPSNRSICYSLNSPATDAQFHDLQSAINRYAGAAGFALIAVDGLIGEGTATAARKAIDFAVGHLPDSSTVKTTLILLRPFAASRQLIAMNAGGIQPALLSAAAALGLSAPSSGTQPSQPPSIPPVPYVPPVVSAMVGGGLSPTAKALIGVGAVSTVGILVLLFWKPKRRAEAA